MTFWFWVWEEGVKLKEAQSLEKDWVGLFWAYFLGSEGKLKSKANGLHRKWCYFSAGNDPVSFFIFLLSLPTLIFTFSPCFNEKSTFSPNSSLSILGFSDLHRWEVVQFIAISFILEDHSEIKGIIPIPECHTHPQVASSWIFQPHCVAS